MPLLIRKLNRAKWPQNNEEDVFKISSDAITNCLRTSSNTLSVWQIEKIEELEEAVLAIVSSQDYLEPFDVVYIEEDFTTKNDISVKQSRGRTPVADLAENHHDFCDLNYYKVGILAEYICKRINIENYKRFTKSQLKKILVKALDVQRLDINDLSESIREKIK